jgi:chemotaxis protein methyltransferase CheR
MRGLPDSLLSRLSDYLADQIGLHFTPKNWPDLERGISFAAQEFHFAEPVPCIEWLMSSPLTRDRIEILSSHLTVGETYFFREKRAFEILEQNILPELIRSRYGQDQSLRIWSAASCTGEEAYSIAMILNQLLPNFLATDINPRFLQKAKHATYNQWSLRDTPEWIQKKYFHELNQKHFEILPSIQRRISFSYLNLAEDCYPSLLNGTNGMDIIFCRNVLMYFAPDRARKVIQKLQRCLVDGGWLIVGFSETSSSLFAEFKTVNFPGAVLYQKEPQQQLAANFRAERIPVPFVESSQVRNENFPVRSHSLSSLVVRDPYDEALVAYKEGRYADAEEQLRPFLSSHTENAANPLALLARAYANHGKINDALASCDRAIELDKLNPTLHYLRAIILQEQDQIEHAAAALKNAIYLDPDFVLAHFTLGAMTFHQGRFSESQKYFRNALQILKQYASDEIVPESEGISARRLMEIIESRLSQGAE